MDLTNSYAKTQCQNIFEKHLLYLPPPASILLLQLRGFQKICITACVFLIWVAESFVIGIIIIFLHLIIFHHSGCCVYTCMFFSFSSMLTVSVPMFPTTTMSTGSCAFFFWHTMGWDIGIVFWELRVWSWFRPSYEIDTDVSKRIVRTSVRTLLRIILITVYFHLNMNCLLLPIWEVSLHGIWWIIEIAWGFGTSGE